ncbi:MAG: VCBS repeat-containing protein [Phycisphaerae bacterium]|nr:VCBS repeat-containing protein [Phycisphaerae bacterium]
MRIKMLALAAITLAVTGFGITNAQIPKLKKGFMINDGDKPIDMKITAAPEMVDWNNDGKLDLLVGAFIDGKIELFINKGTKTKPKFEGGIKIQAEGKDIRLASG